MVRQTMKNAHEAKAVGLEVWQYLADHPEISKGNDLPKELRCKINDLRCRCTLCPELLLRNRPCPGCVFVLKDYNNLMVLWAQSKNEQNREAFARAIIGMIRKWNTEKTEKAKAEIANIRIKYMGKEAVIKADKIYKRFVDGRLWMKERKKFDKELKTYRKRRNAAIRAARAQGIVDFAVIESPGRDSFIEVLEMATRLIKKYAPSLCKELEERRLN
jgi:hypothetical protein